MPTSNDFPTKDRPRKGWLRNLDARARTTVLLNVASIVERADEQVLPAVFFYMGRSLKASPSELGTITLCRAMTQALSSFFTGVLGDKYDRTHLVALGCALWGVCTAALGLAASIPQAMVWAAVNGVGLALVIPCIASLIADYNPSATRGRAFGIMSLVGAFGGMAGGFFATNVAGTQPWGLEGWRFSFHLTAGISLVTAGLVLQFATDPRPKPALTTALAHLRKGAPAAASAGAHAPPLDDAEAGAAPLLITSPVSTTGVTLGAAPPPDLSKLGRRRGTDGVGGQGWPGVAAAWADVRTVLRIRTFQVLVLQGIVGMIPWYAMVFFTLWLQLTGFSDLSASGLVATFSLGCALGACAGGFLGDAAQRRWPDAGRIMVNQVSVAVSLPLSYYVLRCLPAGPGVEAQRSLYAGALLVFGLLISWCGVNNSAMFADVVPEDLRSTIYAFDRAFEGACGAAAMPLVGLVAERIFGFEGTAGSTRAGGSQHQLGLEGGAGAVAAAAAAAAHDAANADALARALLVCLQVPWAFCLVFFTGLYYTFPRDRRAALSETHHTLHGTQLATFDKPDRRQ